MLKIHVSKVIYHYHMGKAYSVGTCEHPLASTLKTFYRLLVMGIFTTLGLFQWISLCAFSPLLLWRSVFFTFSTQFSVEFDIFKTVIVEKGYSSDMIYPGWFLNQVLAMFMRTFSDLPSPSRQSPSHDFPILLHLESRVDIFLVLGFLIRNS